MVAKGGQKYSMENAYGWDDANTSSHVHTICIQCKPWQMVFVWFRANSETSTLQPCLSHPSTISKVFNGLNAFHISKQRRKTQSLKISPWKICGQTERIIRKKPRIAFELFTTECCLVAERQMWNAPRKRNHTCKWDKPPNRRRDVIRNSDSNVMAK